jgi:peptide deformylase
MEKFKILIAPHPLLREKAKEVEEINESLKATIAQMFKIMKDSKGVGLAAPQLGISKRIFVMGGDEDEEKVPFGVWINPSIKPISKEKAIGVEGCLSFPGLELPILRFTKIKVKGKDEKNRPREAIYEGYPARVVQHEFDHLEGILFTDRLKPLRIVLMGSPEFAVEIFEAIYTHPAFEVVLVVSESDKPKGRGLKIQPTPVSSWAEKRKLPLFKVE